MAPLALIKIGGAQLDGHEGRARLGRSLLAAKIAGWQLVLVHGGGPQIAALTKRLGLEERRHLGLRITDAATAEAVQLALAGGVNKDLVRSLGAVGLAAVGLCGADGGLFDARPIRHEGVDLGFVGEPDTIRPHIVHSLLAAGYVPAIATVAAHRVDEPFYNINADHAAGPLAAALGAASLVYLTDVPGVLDAKRQPFAQLSPESAKRLIEEGTVSGGMIPKVETALAALATAPAARVSIAPGAGAPGRADHAVLDALEGKTGTQFVATQTLRT